MTDFADLAPVVSSGKRRGRELHGDTSPQDPKASPRKAWEPVSTGALYVTTCEVCFRRFRSAGSVKCIPCMNELRVASGLDPLPPLEITRVRRQRLDIRGLTEDQYRRLIHDQGSACAICKTIAPDATKLHIDHNHATGEVRGLLCSRCNTGLGMFRDSPAVIHQALGYLEERGCYGRRHNTAEESA